MIQPCQQAAAAAAAASSAELPEWDLSDLYASPDAPEVERDLAAAEAAAVALESEFKGRLDELDGDGLAEVIERYERIEEQLGRVGSYAQLLHAARTDDPEIGRFFQSVQERVNEIGTRLLFVTLEINRIEDAALAAKLERSARLAALPALAARRPQLPPASARRRDRARPAREVDHRAQRLGPAVRRDHGRPALPARRQGADQRRDLRPALGQGPHAGARRPRARSRACSRAARGCSR